MNNDGRKKAYERRMEELQKICERCRKMSGEPTSERCTYCANGEKVRWLEAEYYDVTGWSHKKW